VRPFKPSIPAAEMQAAPPDSEATPLETNRPELTALQRKRLAIAQRVCNAYVKAVRTERTIIRQRESQYVPSDKMDDWLKVADVLISRGWPDPEGFVAAQLRSERIPYPRELSRATAIDRYAKFLTQMEEGLVARFNSERVAWQYAVDITRKTFPHKSLKEIEQAVAVDLQFTNISALFRYCIAHASGYMDAVARLHDVALRQLIVNPAGYAQTWLGKIPKSLLDEAMAQLVVEL